MILENRLHRRSALKVLGACILSPLALGEQNELYTGDSDIRRSLGESLYDSSVQALYFIGPRGGYLLTKPKKSKKIKVDKVEEITEILIPYYYDQGEIFLPKLSDLEKEISDFIERDSLKRLDEKVTLQKNGSKISTKTKIEKGKIAFNYDVTIKLPTEDPNLVITLRTNLDYSFESKLFEMYEIAKYYTDSHRGDSESISITVLSDMAEKRDLYINMMDVADVDNETLVKISTIKEDEKLDNKEKVILPIVYTFLNRYPEKKKNKRQSKDDEKRIQKF